MRPEEIEREARHIRKELLKEFRSAETWPEETQKTVVMQKLKRAYEPRVPTSQFRGILPPFADAPAVDFGGAIRPEHEEASGDRPISVQVRGRRAYRSTERWAGKAGP